MKQIGNVPSSWEICLNFMGWQSLVPSKMVGVLLAVLDRCLKHPTTSKTKKKATGKQQASKQASKEARQGKARKGKAINQASKQTSKHTTDKQTDRQTKQSNKQSNKQRKQGKKTRKGKTNRHVQLYLDVSRPCPRCSRETGASATWRPGTGNLGRGYVGLNTTGSHPLRGYTANKVVMVY